MGTGGPPDLVAVAACALGRAEVVTAKPTAEACWDVGLPMLAKQRSGCQALPGSVLMAVTVLRGHPIPAGGEGLVSLGPAAAQPLCQELRAREFRSAPPRGRLERWGPEPAL